MSWADLKYQQALSPSEPQSHLHKTLFSTKFLLFRFQVFKAFKVLQSSSPVHFFFFCFLKFIHNQRLGEASLLNIAMACSYAGMTGQGQLSMGCANLDCSRWHGDDMVGAGETDRKALAIWAWGAESEHQQPLQSMPSMLICPYNASTRT